MNSSQAMISGMRFGATICLTLLTFSTGCSLVGAWQVVDWQPHSSPEVSRLADVTFSPSGRYTTTESADGGRTTSVGDYKWFSPWLTMTADDGERRKYTCWFTFDGNLVIRRSTSQGPTTFTLHRRD